VDSDEDERAQLLHDQHAGACAANGTPGRIWPDCLELGYYKPFYQAYVCRKCVEADRRCIDAGHLPPWWPNAEPDHAGH
jgi:hypothetical protein